MWFKRIGLAAALLSCTAGIAFAQARQKVTVMALDVVNFRGGLEQFIAEFQKKNPDVEIVANFTPQLGAQFVSLLQADNLNDVTLVASPRIIQNLASGKLAPLPADFTAKLRGIVDVSSLEPVTRGDQMFAVPYNFYPNAGVVMYNQRLWKEANIDPGEAQNWEDFMRLSQQLTKRDANGKMTQSGFSAQREPFAIFLGWLLQLGGKPFNENGTAAFNDEAGRKALQLYADIYQKWKVDDYAFAPTVDAFNKEQAAATMIGPWYESILAKNYPNIKVGHVKQPALPGVDPAQPRYWALQEVWALLVSRQGQSKEGAWRFVEFLLQPDIAARWSAFSGEMTTVKAALSEPIVKNTPYLAPYVEALNYGVSKNIPRYMSSDVTKVLTAMLESVARGQASVQDALDAAEKETNRLTARIAPR